MKLSEETKARASEYVTKLQAQIKSDIGIEMSNRNLQPIKQKYIHELHLLERTKRLVTIEKEANELGYVLVKRLT